MYVGPCGAGITKPLQWRRAAENKYVFNARLKPFCVTSAAANAGARLFQVVGPLTL